MKNKKLLLLVLIMVVLLGGAGFLYSQLTRNVNNTPTPQGTNHTPVAAPTFTVTDSNGATVSLEDFRGKPVVINFWATWCDFCVKEMPHFEESFKQHGDEVQFLMVNVQESPDVGKNFIEKNDYTFPVYFDTAGRAFSAYGLTGLPATFFIDADGNAVAQARGAVTAEKLQRGIDLIYPQA